MTHLISNDIVSLISLVVSVLVILYIIGYCAMLYFQVKQGKARKDWQISIVFYLGILLLAIGYTITLAHFCFGATCTEGIFNLAYLAALILFVYGFEVRAGQHSQLQATIKPSSKKRKK